MGSVLGHPLSGYGHSLGDLEHVMACNPISTLITPEAIFPAQRSLLNSRRARTAACAALHSRWSQRYLRLPVTKAESLTSHSPTPAPPSHSPFQKMATPCFESLLPPSLGVVLSSPFSLTQHTQALSRIRLESAHFSPYIHCLLPELKSSPA